MTDHKRGELEVRQFSEAIIATLNNELEQKPCKSAKIVEDKAPVALLPTATGSIACKEANSVTKRIPLRNGGFAVVDDDVYNDVSQDEWSRTFYGYAIRSEGGKAVWMHRQIMKPLDGQLVDHVNHNKLDNRRKNLRICSQSQNQQNRRKIQSENGHTHSQYKGVSWSKVWQRWVAAITKDYKKICLGSFCDERKAALAYDSAARQLFGEFALLNLPDETIPPVRLQPRSQSSQYKGVTWHKHAQRWKAYIYKNSKRIELGSFKDEVEAARAADAAALEHKGQKAWLNFPEDRCEDQ